MRKVLYCKFCDLNVNAFFRRDLITRLCVREPCDEVISYCLTNILPFPLYTWIILRQPMDECLCAWLSLEKFLFIKSINDKKTQIWTQLLYLWVRATAIFWLLPQARFYCHMKLMQWETKKKSIFFRKNAGDKFRSEKELAGVCTVQCAVCKCMCMCWNKMWCTLSYA